MAVLTQERALRLLSANEGLSFDELYIDEAHHLYDSTGRAILLTRLIRLVRRRNESASLFYLSPVIAEVSHHSSLSNSEIAEIRVRFNMKEPRYRFFEQVNCRLSIAFSGSTLIYALMPTYGNA